MPKVIIIDALYSAIKGSITKDDVVNEFNHAVRMLQKACDCAVVLVHHMTKPTRNPNTGEYYERNDKDSYGSAFLGAAVDHVFWLDNWKKDKDDKSKNKDRVLKCDTQRGGNIIDVTRIRLHEPDPLYFAIVGKRDEDKHKVLTLLKSAREKGMTMDELIKKSGRGRSLIYDVLKPLQDESIIIKENTRPVLYKIKI